MEDQKRIECLEHLLTEALELLDDNKNMMALFSKQYYNKLKAKVDAYRKDVYS